MTKQAYAAEHNSDGKPYVNGPGDGLSYYSGTLQPSLVCKTEEEAKRAAEIANIAYAEGYTQARRDMRSALGIP